MAKFILTNRAVEDLGKIWNYTFDNWSENQADKYYLNLLRICQTIADSPTLGKNYYDILEGLHGMKVNSHIIFYRKIEPGNVEIIRILHGSMDLKNQIGQ